MAGTLLLWLFGFSTIERAGSESPPHANHHNVTVRALENMLQPTGCAKRLDGSIDIGFVHVNQHPRTSAQRLENCRSI